MKLSRGVRVMVECFGRFWTCAILGLCLVLIAAVLSKHGPMVAGIALVLVLSAVNFSASLGSNHDGHEL